MVDEHGNDEHTKVANAGTYTAFMTWMKWGIAIIAVILILMAIFLA